MCRVKHYIDYGISSVLSIPLNTPHHFSYSSPGAVHHFEFSATVNDNLLIVESISRVGELRTKSSPCL